MKKVEFVYAKDVVLTEMVKDQQGEMVPRYGPRLNPVPNARSEHEPLASGQLFDRLNPTRRIFPVNYEIKTDVFVTATGKVEVKQAGWHLPGQVFGD